MTQLISMCLLFHYMSEAKKIVDTKKYNSDISNILRRNFFPTLYDPNTLDPSLENLSIEDYTSKYISESMNEFKKMVSDKKIDGSINASKELLLKKSNDFSMLLNRVQFGKKSTNKKLIKYISENSKNKINYNVINGSNNCNVPVTNAHPITTDESSVSESETESDFEGGTKQTKNHISLFSSISKAMKELAKRRKLSKQGESLLEKQIR